MLDPALVRPGRFDRIIYVGAPDFEGRIEVLKVGARALTASRISVMYLWRPLHTLHTAQACLAGMYALLSYTLTASNILQAAASRLSVASNCDLAGLPESL